MRLYYGDMTDYSSLLNVITDCKPDEIYNLAGQSHVAISFQIPDYTYQVNAIGNNYLLEIIRKVNKSIKFYQASTAEMYGTGFGIHSKSPYATSKIAAYWNTINTREAYGLFACNGILFNHESERRGENFLTRKITLGIKGILSKQQEVIEVGNIYSQRDWGYAPEYVEAIWRMLQRDKADDYIIGTGEMHSVKEFITVAFEAAGNKIAWQGEGLDEIGIDNNGIIRVKINPKFFRPSDVAFVKADIARARALLLWEPKTKFNELVKILVEKELLK